MADLVTLADVANARLRIRDHVFLSPCRKSTFLSDEFASKIYLKLDNQQLTGSFKERGACNRLMSLSDVERKRGVIAASAGNHAQAVAYHGTRLGIASTIVMPEGTPLVKINRTRNFGGKVVLFGQNFDDAYKHARELEAQSDLIFVHPFEDPAIIAGQGTMGLEILEQVPDIDTIVVAIGGGGLAAGVGVAIKALRPQVKVIGVEPAVLPSMTMALKARESIELEEAQTLADGIAVRKVGTMTRELVAKYLDEIVTVSEHEIARAILYLLEQEKTLAEGAGAASLAALMAGKIELGDRRICTVICGGNIDVNVIARIIEHGLVATGRMHRLVLRITDTPGTLANLLTLIGKLRANVLEVDHNRTFTSGESFGSTNVKLTMETRGPDHIEEIRTSLSSAGYVILGQDA